MNFYIYYKTKDLKEEFWVYERTCGSLSAAKDRVKELKKRYLDAVYRDDIMEGAFY